MVNFVNYFDVNARNVTSLPSLRDSMETLDFVETSGVNRLN